MPRSSVSPTVITHLTAEPLNLPLYEPFTIATGRMTSVRNVLIRATLADGTVGIGEAAPFPPSGGETQETTLAAALGMVPLVEGQEAANWRPLADRLVASFEHQGAARTGVEMAILDALTRSWGISLYQFFGGSKTRLETDVTIPIETPEHMARLAARYAEQGAEVLKIKVGEELEDDIDRVLAVTEGAPDCDLILDGNQGYTPSEALELLTTLAGEDVRPILLEQPVHRHDLEGLRFVTEHAGIPVAADESVHTDADALRIARMGAASVINIKIMKYGIVEALKIAAVCRAAHLGLMIGAMMESRLSIATSAHLVAGLGGFGYIDLDTPMLLAEDPFTGGYVQDGMSYLLDSSVSGHGVSTKTSGGTGTNGID